MNISKAFAVRGSLGMFFNFKNYISSGDRWEANSFSAVNFSGSIVTFTSLPLPLPIISFRRIDRIETEAVRPELPANHSLLGLGFSEGNR